MSHIYAARLIVLAAALVTLSVCGECASATYSVSSERVTSLSSSGAKADPVPKPEMIYATGEGAMATAKEQPNRAKAYLEAKRYAKMQALADLIQEARGTYLSYHSEGKGYVAEERITQQAKGVLARVQVISTRKKPEGSDTIVEVTVRAPVPETWKKPAATDDDDEPTPVVNIDESRETSGYSSVVIDAIGFNVARSMSPKILRPDGSEVWGTVKADPGFVADHGIVAYTRNLADALANRRAGGNPLILRATARGGSPTHGDVVISEQDAADLIARDKTSGFLKDFRVVFVVDPAK